MMSPGVWVLVALQIAMGAFDTLYHHEWTERLAWRASQRRELRLHAIRNGIYAILFLVFGWIEVGGVFAIAILALLGVEIVLTLWDFVEEDRTRKLPASERVTHTFLALNYGAILTLLLPELIDLANAPTGLEYAPSGYWSLLASVSAIAVFLFGVRDYAASRRLGRPRRAPACDLVSPLPASQRILIAGATGFVGKRLVESLISAGHEVMVVARDPLKAAKLGVPIQIFQDWDQIPSDSRIDAVINLAGESMGEGLWTRARKRVLLSSRLAMTSGAVGLIARLQARPPVLVNASAIGWYGLYDDEVLTEESPGRACFCRDVCIAWEQEAQKAASDVTRVVSLRIGLVLDTDGGLLSRFLLPFEFGLGGPMGTGRQWMSWIARDDLVRLIAHVLATPSLAGPVNATAPVPERNAAFGKKLGRALMRPAILPLPAAPLRALGDFGKELLLGGQYVLPQKATATGFVFRYPTLELAFQAFFGKDTSSGPVQPEVGMAQPYMGPT